MFKANHLNYLDVRFKLTLLLKNDLIKCLQRQVRNSICFKYSNEFEMDKASRYTGNTYHNWIIKQL